MRINQRFSSVARVAVCLAVDRCTSAPTDPMLSVIDGRETRPARKDVDDPWTALIGYDLYVCGAKVAQAAHEEQSHQMKALKLASKESLPYSPASPWQSTGNALKRANQSMEKEKEAGFRVGFALSRLE